MTSIKQIALKQKALAVFKWIRETPFCVQARAIAHLF